MASATNVTAELYRQACQVFSQMWDGKTPLRQLGVQVTQLSEDASGSTAFFDEGDYDRLEKLDTAVDAIREKIRRKGDRPRDVPLRRDGEHGGRPFQGAKDRRDQAGLSAPPKLDIRSEEKNTKTLCT